MMMRCSILFVTFATTALLAVAALTARVPRRSAQLVIRPARITLVRVAWIAILGPVAHALVAVTLYRRAGLLASGDIGAGHRYRGHRQGIPIYIRFPSAP